ncbi:MAG: DUF1499 domain-containing protein [Gemmatimonadota bacterium]
MTRGAAPRRDPGREAGTETAAQAGTTGPVRDGGARAVSRPDPWPRVAAAGLLAALAAAAADFSAGPGTRMGWWPFRTGFDILRWAALGGLAGAAVSFAAGLATRSGPGRRGLRVAAAGLLVGLSAAGVPWSYGRLAKAVPAIHDITTDTEHPPEFVALLAARREAPNGAAYGGPGVAAKQRAAYPAIRPALLGIPPGEAFDRALAAARKAGWRIAAADRADGRIEATATTFWFGFKDDVVVRIAPDGSGSRVDVRSVSRVGKSDLGTNARRIREYLKALSSPR